METISNIAASAAQAVWPSTHNDNHANTATGAGNHTTASNNSYGEEPLSGVLGDTSKGEPYDAGNMEGAQTPRSMAGQSGQYTAEGGNYNKHSGTLPGEYPLSSASGGEYATSGNSNTAGRANHASAGATRATQTSYGGASHRGAQTSYGGASHRGAQTNYGGASNQAAQSSYGGAGAGSGLDTAGGPGPDIGRGASAGRTAPATTAPSSTAPVNSAPSRTGAPSAGAGAGSGAGVAAATTNKATPGTAPSTIPGHTPGTGPGAATDKLGQSSGESGTGEKYVRSSGLKADGGDFDAANPGAGREADRLMAEKGVLHSTGQPTQASETTPAAAVEDPSGSRVSRDSGGSNSNAASTEKPSLGEKIKAKLKKN